MFDSVHSSAGEEWPSSEIGYAFPDSTIEVAEQWRRAIEGALRNGLMSIVQLDGSDFFELSGSCPRCGHPMDQSLEFDVIRGRTVHNRGGWFNVRCNCSSSHGGRPVDRRGCGWGGPIRVWLSADHEDS